MIVIVDTYEEFREVWSRWCGDRETFEHGHARHIAGGSVTCVDVDGHSLSGKGWCYLHWYMRAGRKPKVICINELRRLR